MKRLLIILALVIAIPAIALAQKEQDFATKFMELNGNTYKELSRSTVSPYMMERIMKLDTLEDNDEIRKVLSQLKSIQIVEAKGKPACDSLFNKATELAQQNPRRYKLYVNDTLRKIYLRTKKDIIVEMVFIANANRAFNLVNLTGNMSESFLKELTNL